MLIGDQRSSASPCCPSPAWPAGWGAQTDLRGQQGTKSQQCSLLVPFSLVLLVAGRGRLVPFSQCFLICQTNTGRSYCSRNTEVASPWEKAVRQKSLLIFFAHQGLRGVVLKKTCSCHYRVGQNRFLLTSHQMKITSHTITGKDTAASPVPRILLSVMTRLQSSFHESSDLPHRSFSRKEKRQH